MGLFSGPRQSKEEYERGVHLNLISRINSLELIAYEQGAKLQVVQATVEELHKQAEMNGRLLTENAELRERIAELEAALREALDYIDDPYNDLAIQIGKTLENSK